MAEQDQTSEETLEKEETSEETAVEEKETPPEEKTTEPEVDYRVKFRESQREAIRLKKELEREKEKPPEKVETETEGETLDQIVEKKVQEKVAPLTRQQEEEKVEKWFEKNPGAYDYLKEIEDGYEKMPGKTVEQKLENSFLVASKDAAKQAGKKEMAFSIYQKEQAVASGGGVSAPSGESLPSLSEEEKKVAQSMGIKEETYAKRKLESNK